MYQNIALLILRLSSGGFMLFAHGLPKLMDFTARATRFPDPLGIGPTASLSLAIFAEVFCAALIIFGLATRFAAIPLIITMAVAAFIVHASDPFARQELPLLFGAVFLALALTGGGEFSLDRILKNRR
jgi:putative oxidoreductase